MGGMPQVLLGQFYFPAAANTTETSKQRRASLTASAAPDPRDISLDVLTRSTMKSLGFNQMALGVALLPVKEALAKDAFVCRPSVYESRCLNTLNWPCYPVISQKDQRCFLHALGLTPAVAQPPPAPG